MIRNIVAWSGPLLAAAWVVCAPLDAWTHVKRMVEPGKKGMLVDLAASTPISAASAVHGRADVRMSSDGQHSPLVYTAPASGTADDVVTYATSSVSTTIGIAVAKAEAPGKTPTDADTYVPPPTFKVLFAIFVLAVILESGLAVLFNWRPFLMKLRCQGRQDAGQSGAPPVPRPAIRPRPVHRPGEDPLGSALPSQRPGYFITALVLAGGSGSVSNLMVALGFRSVKTAVLKSPATQAWIAVPLTRKVAVGPVYVLLTQDGDPKMVVGSISGSQSQEPTGEHVSSRPGRFPS